MNNDSIKIFLCVEEYGEPNNLVIKIVYKKACEKLVNRNYIAGMCTLLPNLTYAFGNKIELLAKIHKFMFPVATLYPA